MITALEVAILAKARKPLKSGERHHKAKLTDAQVAEMRALHEEWQRDEAHLHPNDPERRGYRALAQIYGCAWATARDICLRRTRK